MKYLNKIFKDEYGGAIIEATFVFPIMMLIIMGLVLLSIYLPIKGILQYATQTAANAMSIELSDTWVRFDDDTKKYIVISNDELKAEGSVYTTALRTVFANKNEPKNRAETIVNDLYDSSIALKIGEPVDVNVEMLNAVIYKEITVTAEKTIPIMINLSFVGFPSELNIKSSSTSVVQNGDEMIRNLDIVKDVVIVADEKYNISEKFEGIKKMFSFKKKSAKK